MKIIALLIFSMTITATAQSYYMPGEDLEHEGTWLQWPHNELYGPYYQDDVEPSWIEMTRALVSGEKVHVVALDAAHQTHIQQVLTNSNVSLTNIDFHLFGTNDVWVRDNGPIYVYDENDDLVILDFGFNGWGDDAPYALCDQIPAQISSNTGVTRINLSALVLEGGAIEHDGHGTMMATRSSVTHSSRNPNLTETQIEDYMRTYLGFDKFIWLDGVYGQDITDHHIDGFVKFANDSVIVTLDSTDLDYWLVTPSEMNTIYGATNVDGDPYQIVTVPLTQNDVQTTHGANLGYKGSYCNYYIANDVVLVPIYNDPNDGIALNIIQGLYPGRTVTGINVQNLYEYGGMVHCVTQQQPVAFNTTGLNTIEAEPFNINVFPNPCNHQLNIKIQLNDGGQGVVQVFDELGRLQFRNEVSFTKGIQTFSVPVSQLKQGWYRCELITQTGNRSTQSFIVKR